MQTQRGCPGLPSSRYCPASGAGSPRPEWVLPCLSGCSPAGGAAGGTQQDSSALRRLPRRVTVHQAFLCHMEVISCIFHVLEQLPLGRGRSTSVFSESNFLVYASICPSVSGKNGNGTLSPWYQTPGWLRVKSKPTYFSLGWTNTCK